MSTALTALPAIVLFLTVAARLPNAIRTVEAPQRVAQRISRWYTANLAVIATACVFRVPSTIAALNRLTNNAATDVVVKAVLIVFAVATLREVTIASSPAHHSSPTDRAGRTRLIASGAVLVYLLVLGLIAPPRAHEPAYVGPATATETAWLVAFYSVFLAFFGATLILVARSSWAACRAVGDRVRASFFAATALGACVGIGWVVDQAVLLVLNRIDADSSIPDALYPPLVTIALFIFAIGALGPFVVHQGARLRARLTPHGRRAAAREDLWAALAAATPSIVLLPGPHPISSYREITEIRDGILAVRPFVSPTIRAAVDGAGSQARPRVAAAAVLELARRAKLNGASAGEHSPLHEGEGATFADDEAGLGQLAATWSARRTKRLVAKAERHLQQQGHHV